MNAAQIWNSFAAAVRFLTIFPLGKETGEKIDSRLYLISFPVIGILIGVALLLTLKLFINLIPQFILSSVIITLYLIITRMLHLDGLLDTFEGLLGGQNKEEALRIMKDPHVGSFGIVVAVLYLLSFWGALAHLTALEQLKSSGLGALVAASCLGRWAMIFAATISKPARAEGLGAQFLKLQSKENLLWASFIPVIVAVGIFEWFGLLVLAAVLLLAWGIQLWSQRKIGGVTGDILGAILELTQLLVLFAATLSSRFEA